VNVPGSYYSLTENPAAFAGGPGILMYHKVARAPLATNLPDLYVDPANFRRQMRELAASGLPCLPFGEVAGAAREQTPGYCLTFDDGFRNVFDFALPVLQEYGLRSIQFIVAGRIGGEDTWDRAIGEPAQPLMNAAEIQAWVAAGQEIGAHTVSHPRLTSLPPAAARAEIFESKKLLEDRFGLPIRYFCYPYGDCNEQVCAWVAEAGYAAASTVEPGVNGLAADPLRLRRFMAAQHATGLGALPGKLARTWRRRRAPQSI
jgi:peptidoglycan/xylan/chitin deacetylase (PgdA/CDA1 family)